MNGFDFALILALYGAACWAFYRLGREQGWDRGWDEGMLTGRRLLREEQRKRNETQPTSIENVLGHKWPE